MGRSRVLLTGIAVLIGVASGLALTNRAAAGGGDGVRWEADLDLGLARAAREGRPILIAVNALAEERANQRLRHELYPSAAWGNATREYVCFVANPNTHASGASGCDTYPGTTCESHQTVLRYVAHRFDPVSGALISPQHIVLEPDGGVAFRKEYYTSVVSPALLESLGVSLAPELAYERAGSERADRILALEGLTGQPLHDAARTWLRGGDALAAAGVLRAIDFASSDAQRLLLIRALEATPTDQLPVVDLLADEYGARPDDRPEAALGLARALLAADRERGVGLLARILVRTEKSALGAQARAAWTAGARPSEWSDREAALFAEALLLSGKPPPRRGGTAPADMRHRLRRAEILGAGARGRLHLPLPEALADGRAGRVRASLYEADPDAVRRHAAAVRQVLRERPESRVRYAAAIALMGAGLDEEGRVAALVWEAVNDPVEGPEARQEAVRRLGEDPGWNEEVWIEAARQAAAGSRR